jgi:hypothetical protein
MPSSLTPGSQPCSGSELANLCAETLDGPIKAAQRGVERVRSDEDLLFGFLKATGLSL